MSLGRYNITRNETGIRLIPSSSEDLTFASTTSETNGRNTTILNVTIERKKVRREGVKNKRKQKKRTFIPQTPISIPHLTLSNLHQIKHGDAQPDIVQDLVGVNRVDLVNERLVRGDTELVGFDRNGILPERDRTRMSWWFCTPLSLTRGEQWYLDYGQDKHPGGPSPRDRITSSHSHSSKGKLSGSEAGPVLTM